MYPRGASDVPIAYNHGIMRVKAVLRDAALVPLSVAASYATIQTARLRDNNQPSTLRARRFELVDSSGHVAAVLEESPRGAHLVFHDAKGRTRLDVGMFDDTFPRAEFIGRD